MSFKISNVIQDEANREWVRSVFETVNSAKTLDPSIAVTKVALSGSSYTIVLPNGTMGEHKIVTVVSNTGGNVTIQYNGGWGGSTTIGLISVGDTVEFIATVGGWHNRNWID